MIKSELRESISGNSLSVQGLFSGRRESDMVFVEKSKIIHIL